jgi:hypothetical protein
MGFFLSGRYSVLRPVRDAMGTVYGVEHIQELFTGTFISSELRIRATLIRARIPLEAFWDRPAEEWACLRG